MSSPRFSGSVFLSVCSTLFDNDCVESWSFPVAEFTFSCDSNGICTVDFSSNMSCDVESCTGDSAVLIPVGHSCQSLPVTKLEVDFRLLGLESGSLRSRDDIMNQPAPTAKMKRMIRKSMRFGRVFALNLGCDGGKRPSLGGIACCGSMMWTTVEDEVSIFADFTKI